MALRIVDTQMMLTKPAELTNAQSLAQRQGGVNVNMAREVERDTEEEMRRTQATLPADSDGLAISADPEGHGGAQTGENPEPEEPRTPRELSERLAQKMLGLPVNQGKYAKSEEHQIDILV